jgi:hypothetical protein
MLCWALSIVLGIFRQVEAEEGPLLRGDREKELVSITGPKNSGNEYSFRNVVCVKYTPDQCYSTWGTRRHLKGYVKFNPIKTGFLLNNIYKFSSYLTRNTLRLHYKAQPVNTVWGNSRCLL